MLTDNLFWHILVAPAGRPGIDSLQIISGYAAPSMVKAHLTYLAKKFPEKITRVDLILGMTDQGIDRTEHEAYQEMSQNGVEGISFTCYYMNQGIQIHAKSYCWIADGTRADQGFIGSANYTNAAFGKHSAQTEIMMEISAYKLANFWHRFFADATDCLQLGEQEHSEGPWSQPRQSQPRRSQPRRRQRPDPLVRYLLRSLFRGR